jgi:hypothetical protein
MAKPPDADPEARARPFGLSWTGIYAVVLGALALQIAIFAVLTGVFQ